MAVILVLTGLTPERWVDIDQAKADWWSWRLSVSSADTALILLVATLAIGPLHVLAGGRPSVHRPLRRVVGVWAGCVALVHVSFAIFVHTDGLDLVKNWLTAAPSVSDPLPVRGGKRGLANWLGLGQVLLVVILLALSRDAALRRLGPKWWKRLQRLSYVLVALVAVHVLLYQAVEQRINRHKAPVLLVLLFIGVIQIAAATIVRRRAVQRRAVRR